MVISPSVLTISFRMPRSSLVLSSLSKIRMEMVEISISKIPSLVSILLLSLSDLFSLVIQEVERRTILTSRMPRESSISNSMFLEVSSPSIRSDEHRYHDPLLVLNQSIIVIAIAKYRFDMTLNILDTTAAYHQQV